MQSLSNIRRGVYDFAEILAPRLGDSITMILTSDGRAGGPAQFDLSSSIAKMSLADNHHQSVTPKAPSRAILGGRD